VLLRFVPLLCAFCVSAFSSSSSHRVPLLKIHILSSPQNISSQNTPPEEVFQWQKQQPQRPYLFQQRRRPDKNRQAIIGPSESPPGRQYRYAQPGQMAHWNVKEGFYQLHLLFDSVASISRTTSTRSPNGVSASGASPTAPSANPSPSPASRADLSAYDGPDR